MKYCAIATDYDGTLATDGVVAPETQAALWRYQAAGGKLIMATGRQLEDLQRAFPLLGRFDGAVLENGAVFFAPASGEIQVLGAAPPESLATTLAARGVSPVSQGRVILSTWQPHGITVERTLEELGLQARVIMNKRSVMVLPAGVTKATGLRVALQAMGIEASQVVGIGDAENDFDLLAHCGLGVAVANALPEVKAQADRVTDQARGAGVAQLIDWILADQL